MAESGFTVAILWLYWVSAIFRFIPGVFYHTKGWKETFMQAPLFRLFSVTISIYIGILSIIIDRKYWGPGRNDIRKPPKWLRNHVVHDEFEEKERIDYGLPKKCWFLSGQTTNPLLGPLSAYWQIKDGKISYKDGFWVSKWNDDPWIENGFVQFEPLGLSGTVIMIFSMVFVIAIGSIEGGIGWTLLLSLYAFFFPGMADLVWHCTIGTIIGCAREGSFNEFKVWWYRVRLIISVLSLTAMSLCPFSLLIAFLLHNFEPLRATAMVNCIILWLCPGCHAIRRTWFLISSTFIFYVWYQNTGDVVNLVQFA
ncbi:uncharacterized protein OCT59_002535 [Rhizophagus irregularis]|nr:hypothetical protein RirG_139210 [Rhizophagus irregularis DAOM 197198w]UZO10958.1 hypothetical protein OCT59_002535 [Rhizophagus irregularis]